LVSDAAMLLPARPGIHLFGQALQTALPVTVSQAIMQDYKRFSEMPPSR
jgi:hypothetical protein